jgi:hypothetical protein
MASKAWGVALPLDAHTQGCHQFVVAALASLLVATCTCLWALLHIKHVLLIILSGHVHALYKRLVRRTTRRVISKERLQLHDTNAVVCTAGTMQRVVDDTARTAVSCSCTILQQTQGTVAYSACFARARARSSWVAASKLVYMSLAWLATVAVSAASTLNSSLSSCSKFSRLTNAL